MYRSVVVSALLCLASLVELSRAIAVINLGQCPSTPPKADFELERYLNAWYAYEMFDAPYQLWSTCVKAEYERIGDNQISVLNTGIQEISFLGWVIRRSEMRAEGVANVVDAAVPAGLAVRFGEQPTDGKANYLVLDTDYDNFALVYSCSQFWIFKWEQAWILTRQRGVRPDNTNQLKQMLTDKGVDIKNFKPVKQTGCEN